MFHIFAYWDVIEQLFLNINNWKRTIAINASVANHGLLHFAAISVAAKIDDKLLNFK